MPNLTRIMDATHCLISTRGSRQWCSEPTAKVPATWQNVWNCGGQTESAPTEFSMSVTAMFEVRSWVRQIVRLLAMRWPQCRRWSEKAWMRAHLAYLPVFSTFRGLMLPPKKLSRSPKPQLNMLARFTILMTATWGPFTRESATTPRSKKVFASPKNQDCAVSSVTTTCRAHITTAGQTSVPNTSMMRARVALTSGRRNIPIRRPKVI